MEKYRNFSLFIILIPTPDFPHFYYILGGNLRSLLHGDVSVMKQNIVHYYHIESEHFQVPFSRLCSFDSSFFPATLRLWNDLNLSIRNSSTLVEFKAKLRNQDQTDKANDILSIGERKHSIILTRIRHNCSSLNADLNRLNIVPSSACTCGANFETAQHYFFECRNTRTSAIIS